MEKKIIAILSCVFMLLSCRKEDVKIDSSLVEPSRELYSELIRYDRYVDSCGVRKPYYLHIICSDLNDSTNQYILSFINTPSTIKRFPVQFKITVNNKVVFLSFFDCISRKKRTPFFSMNTKLYIDFLKNYFPKDYELFQNEGISRLPDTWDGGECYLTFINGKLIKKEIKNDDVWK